MGGHTLRKSKRNSPPRVHTMARLDPELRARVDKFAEEQNRSVANAIELLLKTALDGMEAAKHA